MRNTPAGPEVWPLDRKCRVPFTGRAKDKNKARLRVGMLEDVCILEANLKGLSTDEILEQIEKNMPIDAFVFKTAGTEGLTYILRVIVQKGQEERFADLLHAAGVGKVSICPGSMHTSPRPSRHLLELHGREPPISHKK